MAPTFVRRSVHGWQHLFMPLLYCLLLVRHSLKEFAYYLAPLPHLDVRHARPPTFSERVRFVLTIIVGHCGLRLAVPLLLLSPGRAWGIFWLSEVVASGYLNYTTFAVNHLFAGAAYPTQPGDQDWALLVLQTTLDYACTSAWTGLLSGWLNCQVAHHLFPLIASEHLPAVRDRPRDGARGWLPVPPQPVVFCRLEAPHPAFAAHGPRGLTAKKMKIKAEYSGPE